MVCRSVCLFRFSCAHARSQQSPTSGEGRRAVRCGATLRLHASSSSVFIPVVARVVVGLVCSVCVAVVFGCTVCLSARICIDRFSFCVLVGDERARVSESLSVWSAESNTRTQLTTHIL